MDNRTIIAITGPIGAGKDEAAKYLADTLGWPIFQISAPLKEEVKRRRLELNRENIQKIGVEFAKTHGDDYLARLALESFDQNGIVSGPRQIGQIKFLRENSRLIFIKILADDKVRYERVLSRGTVKEAPTLETFVQDEKEKDCLGDVQKLDDCMALADYSVENNSILPALHRQLDEILQKENLTPLK